MDSLVKKGKLAENTLKQAQKELDAQKASTLKITPFPEKSSTLPSSENRSNKIEADKLGKEIEKLEKQKETITIKLSDDRLSSLEIVELSKEFEKINQELEHKLERWMNL